MNIRTRRRPPPAPDSILADRAMKCRVLASARNRANPSPGKVRRPHSCNGVSFGRGTNFASRPHAPFPNSVLPDTMSAYARLRDGFESARSRAAAALASEENASGLKFIGFLSALTLCVGIVCLVLYLVGAFDGPADAAPPVPKLSSPSVRLTETQEFEKNEASFRASWEATVVGTGDLNGRAVMLRTRIPGETGLGMSRVVVSFFVRAGKLVRLDLVENETEGYCMPALDSLRLRWSEHGFVITITDGGSNDVRFVLEAEHEAGTAMAVRDFEDDDDRADFVVASGTAALEGDNDAKITEVDLTDRVDLVPEGISDSKRETFGSTGCAS